MRNQRGITLIALVITIIVLLILAGVSIAMLTGQNGLLTRANDATVTTIEGNVNEQVSMALAAARLYMANEAATNARYDARDESKTIADFVHDDLVETSGKTSADWEVEPDPDADDTGGTQEDASLIITYKGDDYKNAKNDDNAQIQYAVRIDQQGVEASEPALMDTKNTTGATVPVADDET